MSDATLPATAFFQWRRLRRWPWTARVIGVCGLILTVVAGSAWCWGHFHRGSPLLSTPRLAIEEIHASSLYYNGLAWPWLKQWRPELLGSEAQQVNSPRVRAFTQAVQSPKLFRQLDRQSRFDALLLVGDPSQYRPLLDHLLETRDWTVAYVDHASLLFQRGALAPWQPGRLAPARARLAGASQRERAIFLAQTARKLVAVREPAAARTLLDEAEQLDPETPDLWSVRAQYHLGRGEWKECEAAANHALQLDSGDLSALGAKAQALYSTKRFNEAYTLSRRLAERLPDDPAMLFYHAKIAHQARAFTEETRALRHLIALAEANDRPTSGYRVYLGQSLATAGEAGPAQEEFNRALSDPELPKEQRAFAHDCLALIRSQVGK